MDNRLLTKYGTYGTTHLGNEISALADTFVRDLEKLISVHNLTVAELHTAQHIILSAVQCSVAEHTLRHGITVRKEERKNANLE